MKIKFINGFQGRETNNIWYPPGKVVNFERELAELLVHDGRAVLAEDAPVIEGDPESVDMPAPEEAAVVAPKAKRGRKGSAK
jgi:hypothetical protein